jgi:hypothetical protein
MTTYNCVVWCLWNIDPFSVASEFSGVGGLPSQVLSETMSSIRTSTTLYVLLLQLSKDEDEQQITSFPWSENILSPSHRDRSVPMVRRLLSEALSSPSVDFWSMSCFPLRISDSIRFHVIVNRNIVLVISLLQHGDRIVRDISGHRKR